MIEPVVFCLLAAGLGYASWSLSCLFIRYMKLRRDELSAASLLLDKYEERVDGVIDDPALPASIRYLLVQFDDAIGHPMMAKALVTRVFSRREVGVPLPDIADDDLPTNEDLAFLAKHRPDLSRDFIKLVSSGFGYTMMKWPFSARMFRLMYVDMNHDAITPAKTLIRNVKHDDHWGTGGGVAAPA
jgi:hypothetical protein